MKPRIHSFLFGCGTLLAASSIQAADVNWDITPGTVGVGDSAVTGGLGTWDTTNGNWTIDAGANNIAWNNGANDTALFGDTGDIVTLGTDISVSGMEFAVGGYTINGAGNTITLGNNGGIRSTNTPGPSLWTNAGTTTINADIDNGGFLFTTVGAGAAILNGVISGSGGFATYNSSNVTLAGDNIYTGKTFITSDTTSGSTLRVSSFNSVDIDNLDPLLPLASSSLGAPATVADGTIDLGNATKQATCTLVYTGPGETTDRVISIRQNGNSNRIIQADGDGLLKFTSAMTSNGESLNRFGKLVLSGTGDGEIVQGVPLLFLGGLEKAGNGTWTLGGANAYTTGTTVTAGTLTINGSVRAETTVITGGTLNGSGTLTFNVDGTAVDSIDISGGTIDLSSFTLSVTEVGSGADQASYIIIDSVDGGSYTGTFASESIPSGYTVNYDFNGLGTQVALVSGASDPFDTWAGTGTLGPVTFDGDTNGDGVQDGVAFLLGVANPDDDANDNLPDVREDGSGNLVMEFNCLPSAGRGTAELRVAHSNTLAAFTATSDQVPDADDAVPDNDVTFVVDTITEAPLNKVTATIGNSVSAVGKLFGRLEATE